MGDIGAKIKEIKMELQALLCVEKDPITAHRVNLLYRDQIGSSIPLFKLGFGNMDSLLQSFPDVIRCHQGPSGQPTYSAVPQAESMHINQLVAGQKSAKHKRGHGGPQFNVAYNRQKTPFQYTQRSFHLSNPVRWVLPPRFQQLRQHGARTCLDSIRPVHPTAGVPVQTVSTPPRLDPAAARKSPLPPPKPDDLPKPAGIPAIHRLPPRPMMPKGPVPEPRTETTTTTSERRDTPEPSPEPHKSPQSESPSKAMATLPLLDRPALHPQTEMAGRPPCPPIIQSPPRPPSDERLDSDPWTANGQAPRFRLVTPRPPLPVQPMVPPLAHATIRPMFARSPRPPVQVPMPTARPPVPAALLTPEQSKTPLSVDDIFDDAPIRTPSRPSGQATPFVGTLPVVPNCMSPPSAQRFVPTREKAVEPMIDAPKKYDESVEAVTRQFSSLNAGPRQPDHSRNRTEDDDDDVLFVELLKSIVTKRKLAEPEMSHFRLNGKWVAAITLDGLEFKTFPKMFDDLLDAYEMAAKKAVCHLLNND